MRASRLMDILNEVMGEYGDMDVCIEVPGFNAETYYSTHDDVETEVYNRDLSTVNPDEIIEDYEDETGIVRCILIKCGHSIGNSDGN
jgi:hypothetical protein